MDPFRLAAISGQPGAHEDMAGALKSGILGGGTEKVLVNIKWPDSGHL